MRNAKRAAASTIVCGLLLVLPSCIPYLRKPTPAPPVPVDFNGASSPENSAELRIEEFYEDPLLVRLIDQALAGSQELRILNENVQIASNEVLARRGAYLPFLTAAGNPVRIDRLSDFTLAGASRRDDPFRPGQFLPNPLPDFALGTNLFWQIDIWRQLRNARDAAIQRLISAAQERNQFVTRLVAEVAENYYRLMALDARIENLNRIIALQERSRDIARARREAARGSNLPVLRFEAEVRKNEAEKRIVNQDIIQTENRINFALGRFPQPIERRRGNFVDLNIHALSLGVPSQLLQNRPDIRQAERELAATGLDVKVARARFYPAVAITGAVGYEAFNPRYLFLTPEALIGNAAVGVLGPVLNFKAIQADYLTANARQLQAVYNYQRVIINAFTEVINRITRVENYGRSIEFRKKQVQALEAAVEAATSLYQLPRVELPIDYLDVLTAQNELFIAIRDLIETKGEQLFAVVNTYQALGGGAYLLEAVQPVPPHYDHKSWRVFFDDIHDQLHHRNRLGPGPNEAFVGGVGKSESPETARAPESNATPAEAAAGMPEAVPAPPTTGSSGPFQPPAPPAAEPALEPVPTPAATANAPPQLPVKPAEASLPSPLPAPGGGEGSGTASEANGPPR